MKYYSVISSLLAFSLLIIACGKSAQDPVASDPDEVGGQDSKDGGTEVVLEDDSETEAVNGIDPQEIINSCDGSVFGFSSGPTFSLGKVDVDVFQCIIDGLKGHEQAPEIYAKLLVNAIGSTNLRAVQLLIDTGIDVTGEGPFGFSFLSIAIQMAVPARVSNVGRGEDAVAIARLLVAKGARITDDYDYTNLWFIAVGDGDVSTVRLMIEAGMDVNTRSSLDESWNPVTALVGAVRGACWSNDEEARVSNTEMVRVLVEAGADVNTMTYGRILEEGDGGGYVVVGIYESSSVLSLAWDSNCPEVVHILKEAGACEDLEGREFKWGRGVGWEGVLKFLLEVAKLQEKREVDCENPRLNPPEPPRFLTAEANGETEINLSWRSNTGEAVTGYRIEVSEDGSTWTDLVSDTQSVSTNHTHRGLSSGSKRYYRVSAINSAGVGPPSVVANATTKSVSLLEAIRRGDVERVKHLVQTGENVNEMDFYGSAALHEAIDQGNAEILRILVDAGADANGRDGAGNSAIHMAVRQDNPEILRILADAGADVNERDFAGNPAIQVVIVRNKPEMVQILIDAGVDANETSFIGNPIIHVALSFGNPEIIQILVNAGADVNAVEKSSRFSTGSETALDVAINKGNPEILRIFLHWAIKENNPQIVLELVEEDADVNARDPSGDTALHLAIRSGSSAEIVRILVEAGADVNAPDQSGDTPLQIAKEVGASEEIVQILTAAGAE